MCGFIGLYSTYPVAAELHEGLMVLQHRGQDAAGIITYNGDKFHVKKGGGLVREIFDDEAMKLLKGNVGVGHVRYPTVGGGGIEDAQPLWIYSPYGIAMAHNGNLFNYTELKQALIKDHHCLVNTGCDVEIILNLFASALHKRRVKKHLTFDDICLATKKVMQTVKGGYSVVCYIAGQGMVAFRDPYGIRPAIWGKRNEGLQTDYIFASEKIVLDILGFETVGDIEPGQVIFIDNERQLQKRSVYRRSLNPCIFEQIYFARPDSFIDNISVYKTRLRLGQNLAIKVKEAKLDIDVVVPVPDSSCSAALALAESLNLKYREGLFKNRYIGRTFIMPEQEKREKSVRRKLNPSVLEIRNKKVLLVDDSIVRGTTSKEIIAMLREVGAKKVYLASTAPPLRFPCLYGIDMPSKLDFIANGLEIEEIRKFIGADALIYQDIEAAEMAAKEGNKAIKGFCMACFNGKYPTKDVTEKLLAENEKMRALDRLNKEQNVDHQLILL